MSFTALLRKSASTVAPLASRLGQRGYHSALFSSLNHQVSLPHKNPSPVVPFLHRFCSTAIETQRPNSTESLVRVLESEIKIAQETDDHDRPVSFDFLVLGYQRFLLCSKGAFQSVWSQRNVMEEKKLRLVEELPKDFPFKFDDNVGQQTVILTREYEGELVKVEVHMPDLVTGEDNDIRDDNDDKERSMKSTIPLVVTVSKKSGTCLVFDCVAYDDEILIDSMSIKVPETSEDQMAYGGPNFHDLDENLKKGLHKYLEIRGIKPSTTDFLLEYMINKDSREYLGWLNNLKQFIEA
ncbi:unnamed protein product [Dovyalis caffra]|uniref:Mitochondrial glycoprotein n=1 Tax=Dovyalis caffra TaxID=77055 RepID=A0AAV1QVU3_9ROSI|nr:unnamed protein product [Dovyalis caffra]